jgi:formate hydrogenlyase transcriptional activator
MHPAADRASLAPSLTPHQDADFHSRHVGPLLQSRSKSFCTALERIERFARFDQATVLIVGESGTGKTFFAEYLHSKSPRAGRVFHRVTLSAIADSLAPSDLFGHVQGAFTDARAKRAGHFVSANGGTLFLDEIAKASDVVQHKLLDAVERHEIAPVGADRGVRVDVRIVAASNVCLQALVDEGRFLPDLFARLDGFVVRIPPLRDRREDIPALVEYCVQLHAKDFGYATPPTVNAELMHALGRAPWPNNVRQLDVTVRRLLAESDAAPVLTPAHCVDTLEYLAPVVKPPRPDVEVVRAAFKAEGKVSAVARKFGVSRTTIYRYLDEGAGDMPIE